MKAEIMMERCLFCDDELNLRSDEHVFLSALGGRMISQAIMCSSCNNAFSNSETGKIDDSLAESFVVIRNGLKIRTGRKGPPPTLLDAGEMPNGAKFSLAPGYIPIVNKAVLPKAIVSGQEYNITVRDEAELARVKDILDKRGFRCEDSNATKVQQKAPMVHFSVHYDLPKVFRGIAKTAVAGFVVMYGNENAIKHIACELRQAIRYGTIPVDNFAGWDFVNDWPEVASITPKTHGTNLSGFDHSLIITDVDDDSVAYVTLFGHWRFSVLLGCKTGLPTRGFALNPRAAIAARFNINAVAPLIYGRRNAQSNSDEYQINQQGVSSAMNAAAAQWSEESNAEYLNDLTDELMATLLAIGEDNDKQAEAFATFAMKQAMIELGQKWETDLETNLYVDSESFI